MNETFVEINLNDLEKNIKTIKNKYDNYDYYIGILKADAYGFGYQIVNKLCESGINYLSCALIEEALEIRKYNQKIPILLLEPISLNNLDLAIKNKLTLTIHDYDYLKELIALVNKKINVHLKIDSGFNRLGFSDRKNIKKSFDLINKNDYLNLEGIYSHFATTGLFDKKWDNQVKKFQELTSLINIGEIPIRHFGSSITLLTHPKIDFCNAVRIGTLMYGYDIGYKNYSLNLIDKLQLLRNDYNKKKYHISETFINVDIKLFPAMKFYTSILQIKKVKKGDTLGYGASIILTKDEVIAIIPIGYSNGIGPKSINRFVVINNKKYQVVSVGMNMSIVIIDDSINLTDKVIILDNENITIGMLGRFTERQFHEMLISIGKNNKRVYVEGDNNGRK